MPQIGRIMRYSYVGDRNVIWNNPDLLGKTIGPNQSLKEWVNYGGDKLWPAPQSRWNWPPDPTLDRAPQTVRMLPNNHLLVTGKSSRKSGIRFQREIALDETGTGVTLQNTMINTSEKPVNWGVWEVTQTDSPDVIKMAAHKEGHFSNGYYTFKDSAPPEGMLTLTEDEVQVHRDTKKPSKIGGDSPAGWIAAEKQGVRFQVSETYEAEKEYPDDGCGQEIYTNPDPLLYIEMELLAPMSSLEPGASTTFVTHWQLSRLGQ